MNLYYNINSSIKRKIRIYSKKSILIKEKEILKDTNFVIISDNCWGGEIYQWYERPYNSPFIGLRVYGECYLKLLSNFDYYMSQKLIFKPKLESKYASCHNEKYYPMGLLDNVEIHFSHYKSEEEAISKWHRRTQRMLQEKNKDNYFFKICDHREANENIMKKFHELPFKNKVSYTLKDKKTFELTNHIGILECCKVDKSRVPDGLRLFKIQFLYFDLTHWLLTRKIKRTTFKN